MRNKKGQFLKGNHWRKPQLFWEKEWLYNEYIIKERSTDDIAKQFNCKDTNIQYFLKKHNIKARTISESRKIKYWGSFGIDNPMYNKIGELNPNWKGGISEERQLFYSSREWKDACSAVWKRDNAICQRCGIRKEEGIPFHIHHKVGFYKIELRSDIENLVLLCEVCHRIVHSRKNITKEFILIYEQFKDE